MALTDDNVAELMALPMATFAGPMSKERIAWHLDIPVCRVLMGVKAHIKAIGYLEAWRLCYTLRCDSLELLEKAMWIAIKKHRKDSRHGKDACGNQRLDRETVQGRQRH